jgi:CRP-like cAMP-binding protein
MKAHPADIADTIQGYVFFQSFTKELLLQISTMMSQASYKAGDLIITEGQKNTKLFFIQSGHAEVLLSGEVVALLQNPGDVFGEMSVVLKKAATTSIRAASDIDCFILDSNNFGHVHPKDKDHFEALLYRVYATILADRLMKTNEKARLFEIANRELHEAQVDLDSLGNKKVLVVQSDRKQLVLARIAVGSTGVQMDTATDLATAESFLAQGTYDAVICDPDCHQVFDKIQALSLPTHKVLMTSKNVSENLSSIKQSLFVDSMVTSDVEDRSLTIRTILTTLTKVLSHQIFGLEKYLTWGVEVQSKAVKSSSHRHELKDEMVAYFKRMGIRNTILDRCFTVAEELLMNAIYDAPTNSKGEALFNHLSRKQEVILDSHLQSKFEFACDGNFIAISTVDPFGALTKDVIVNYLESCYQGRAGELNQGKGGAGRGLHQIIENSDLTIFNVKKGARTEVISLFYAESHRKEENPSFHYFFS